MKLINFQCLLVILIIGAVITQDKPAWEIDPFYQQKQVFPNQFEAATNTTQLDTANYTSPFMSQVLFEEDPKRKLRKMEFVSSLRFQAYRLTKGETEQIFNFADGDKNDLLDQTEWDTFTGLYLLPFEACDRNRDYLLDEKEFAYCFDKDPRSRFITFRRRDQEDRHQKIMWAVTNRATTLINFHEYLFLRRAIFAWKNCHASVKYINKSAFKCAIRTAIPSKLNLKIDIEKMYEAGVVNANEANIIELDFLNYLRTMYGAYVFVIFGEPLNLAYLEKSSFIKAIKEDRLPNNFEEKEIETLYELTNTNTLIPNTQMHFNSFLFFFNLHRLFNHYSVERPHLLTRTEVMKLLGDKLTPGGVVAGIDVSRTSFNETVYQEASLVLKRKRVNEANLFFQFKQDASANTAGLWNDTNINSTYHNYTKNDTNREVFFTTFAENNKEAWTKTNFYRAFMIGNIFNSLTHDTTKLVPASTFVDKLMNQYGTVVPPIGWSQRQSYTLYKSLPREISIDLLVFSTIENFRTKFGSSPLAYESLVKLILQDFGMHNMPDPVIDLAKKGYDNLRRRTYDVVELIKNCAIAQATAGENVRSKEMVTKYHIKTNLDNSRRFPGWPRRAQATPWVR